MKQITSHQCLPNERYFRKSIRATYIAGFFVGTAAAVFLMVLSLFGLGDVNSQIDRIILGGTGICLIYGIPLTCSAGIVTTSDITVEEEGIRLYLFDSKIFFISWEQLRQAEFKKTRISLLYKPWPKHQTTVFPIYMPDLPIIYKITGLYYKLGYTPVFVITTDHDGHELLLDRIRQNLSDTAY